MNRRPEDTVPRSPFAETVPASPVGPPPSGPPQHKVSASGPDIEARYTFRERLGEGGMGEVLLYQDERLGRDVAVKVMRTEHVGRAELDTRFLREARIQGRIEHPSVVPVYDLGVRMADGAPFFTMRRIHGPTLSEILVRLRAGDPGAEERYSRHKLLAAFAAVCLTVECAHAHGVVHRDLKPENIMLGSYGELYILDWGIAKVTGDFERPSRPLLEPETTSRTEAGVFLGTLGYMAPEQVDGALGVVDARSDVYALGAILFEILTLEPLHETGRADRMVISTLGVPARPSVRAPSRAIAPELDEICLRATAREQAKRYASARQLSDALERFREKDRDLEQRRDGGERHAAAAAALVTAVKEETDPDAPLRRLALREVSRALAYDPTNSHAAGTLQKILESPPRVLPAEVDHELSEAGKRLFATVGKGGSILQMTWFLYLPFALAVGIRDVKLYVAVSVMVVIASAAGYLSARKPPADGRLPFTTLMLVAASLAMFSAAWSPFILVPPLAVAVGVSAIVVPRMRAWPFGPVIACSAMVVVPCLLSWAGIVPPFFAVEGGRLMLLPVMLDLPAKLTVIVATVTHVLIVGSIAAWFSHLRSSLDRSRLELVHQTVQLRQLVETQPADRGASILPEPPPPSSSRDVPAVPTVVDTGGGRRNVSSIIVLEPDPSHRYDERGRVSTETDGEILLCEDLRIGRQVAMKVVPKGSSDAKAALRQLRLQARLEHPSIPPVYDLFDDGGGAVRVTLRRLRGTTLAAALSEPGRFSHHKLLGVFGAACLAIDYAHANGVVHRALTSRSIVIGDYGEVYVSGWGSAAEGSDVATDIAALGRILGEVLDLWRSSSGDLDEAASLAVQAPPELEAICARATMTAVGDSDRFRTAAELSQAVERFVEGERDLVRRRARAEEHARVAELAAERATAGAEGSRASAMREVSRALALDPSSERATATLMKLFTMPARTLPREAEEELLREAHEQRRSAARTAAVLYAVCFLYVPSTLLLGVLSPVLAVLILAAFVGAVVAFVRMARSKTPTDEPIATVVFAMLAAAGVGALAGPLVLVPTVVIGNMSGFLLQAGHRRRALVIVTGCLAFAGPIALELAGVLPPSYAAEGARLAIYPRLTPMTAYAPALLLGVHVMVIIAACIFFRRFRDVLHRTEERVQVNNWQYRQLVAAKARSVSMAPAGGP
jgi:eukaryotic-like serine/threonine-protein kinase